LARIRAARPSRSSAACMTENISGNRDSCQFQISPLIGEAILSSCGRNGDLRSKSLPQTMNFEIKPGSKPAVEHKIPIPILKRSNEIMCRQFNKLSLLAFANLPMPCRPDEAAGTLAFLAPFSALDDLAVVSSIPVRSTP